MGMHENRIGFKTWLTLYFMPYLLLIQVRFGNFQFKTLAGDDIYYFAGSRIVGGYGSSFWHSPLDQAYGKWRPVPQIIGSVLLDLFSGDFWKYQVFNEVLLAIAGTLIAVLVSNLIPNAKFLCWIAGSFIVLARFNLYFILQVLGMMESTALIFSISCLISLVKYSRSNSRKYFLLFNIFYFLAIHSHERYLFLFPVLIWVIVFYSNSKNTKQMVLLCIVPVSIVLENYLIKTLVFQTNFFTGGAAQAIDGSLSDISWFSWRGILNLLGYNSGPDYLSGKNANALGNSSVYLAAIWAIPSVLVVVGAIVKMLKNYPIARTLKLTFAFAGTVLSLVLSASITFRQEYRWLLSPYLVFVVVVFSSAGYLFKSSLQRGAVVLVLVIAGTVNGTYYARYAENTYFFMVQRLTDSINDRIFVQHTTELDNATFIIIDHDSPTFDWAVGGGQFFAAYNPGRNIDIRTVGKMEDISLLTDVREKFYIFDYQWNQIIQLD